jgi:hypothetical protein
MCVVQHDGHIYRKSLLCVTVFTAFLNYLNYIMAVSFIGMSGYKPIALLQVTEKRHPIRCIKLW